MGTVSFFNLEDPEVLSSLLYSPSIETGRFSLSPSLAHVTRILFQFVCPYTTSTLETLPNLSPLCILSLVLSSLL